MQGNAGGTLNEFSIVYEIEGPWFPVEPWVYASWMEVRTAAKAAQENRRRIEKTASSKTVYYVYDLAGHAISELNSSGGWNRGEIYAGGRHVATYANNTTYFDHGDWLGTERARTNVSGAILVTCQGLPSGDGLSCSGSDVSPLDFTGKERDAESNLDYFGARYYSSSLGRFMTPDPSAGHVEDPQTLNRYAYARNNPTSLTDPTGLDSYLTCTQSDQNALTCQQETVGYDKNGKAQTAWVQGVTNNGQFTPTLIGNDANGNLVDNTTGTGAYTASVNGSGVQFSNNGGQTSSTGVFVNGTPQTTFQDAGWANNNALTGFTFTLRNSKLEANQLEAGTFTFNGTPGQAGAALLRAGFIQHNSSWFEPGFNSYRSPGSFFTGANSGHFNVYQIDLNPLNSVPQAQGNMHFGEHNPFSPFGWMPHIGEANQ